MTAAAELLGQPGAPAPAPAPGAPAPAPAPGAPAANDLSWVGDGAPPELVGYVQNKGWQTPKDVLEGYRNLEKLVGSKGMPLPKDDKDTEGWGRVYDTLGRPKDPKEYKLPVPEGHDGKFAEVASGKMHELGLSTKQAQGIATWWNEVQSAAAKEAAGKAEAERVAGIAKVKEAWGGALQERANVVDRAMRTFVPDLDEAGVHALQAALGVEKFYDVFYRIGAAIGEHKGGAGLDTQTVTGGALTPEQAKAEIARLKADPAWGKAYAAGDADKVQRMKQLHQWAFPA